MVFSNFIFIKTVKGISFLLKLCMVFSNCLFYETVKGKLCMVFQESRTHRITNIIMMNTQSLSFVIVLSPIGKTVRGFSIFAHMKPGITLYL